MQFVQVDTSGQLRLGHQSEQINTTNTGKAQKVWISQLSMGPVLVFTFHFDHTWSLSVYAPSVSAYLKPAPDFRPSTLLILQELWSRQGSHLKGLHTLAVESDFSVCLVFDRWGRRLQWLYRWYCLVRSATEGGRNREKLLHPGTLHWHVWPQGRQPWWFKWLVCFSEATNTLSPARS